MSNISSCTGVFCVQVSLSRASMTDGMTILAWSAHAHKDKETLWWVICYMWGDVRVFCWTQFSRWPFSSLPAKLDHHTHVNCRPPLVLLCRRFTFLHFLRVSKRRLLDGKAVNRCQIQSPGSGDRTVWTLCYQAPLNLLYFLIGCQHFRMLLQSENTLWPYWTFFVLLHTADRFHSHILVPNYTLSLLHSHICMQQLTVNRWSNVPPYVLRLMFSKYSNTLWCLQELNKKTHSCALWNWLSLSNILHKLFKWGYFPQQVYLITSKVGWRWKAGVKDVMTVKVPSATCSSMVTSPNTSLLDVWQKKISKPVRTKYDS